MTQDFWKQLKKPILCLAPMEDVTDAAFRRVIAKYGKPHVLFTEFTSADGLCSAGKKNMLHDLWFTDNERPIVAQLFGADPEKFAQAAKLVKKLGFDGMDINMGCPVKKIIKTGSCSELIRNPKLAQEIIFAVKKSAHPLPVSVKTRIGYNKNEVETWIPLLLETEPAALTIHGRTRKQMSKVPADWDAIARCVQIRDEMKSKTLIIGNGDVVSVAQAKIYAKKYGVDGVMIGRGIFGKPWLFNSRRKDENMTPRHRLEIMLEHTKTFSELFGKRKNFAVMKKHYKAYVSGWDGAKDLRVRLMETGSYEEVERVVREYFSTSLRGATRRSR